MKLVEDICRELNFIPRTLVEVGAAHADTNRLNHYIREGHKVLLVEANPRLYYCMMHGYNNGNFEETWPRLPDKPYTHPSLSGAQLSVIHAAVTDTNGVVRVFERNASSFVEGIHSPAIHNDGYIGLDKDAYTVPSITIDRIDDQQIDVLLADAEGCEWYCLKHLISRPRLIVLEMRGGTYTNPFKPEIEAWMEANGYITFERDDTDVAFIRTAQL